MTLNEWQSDYTDGMSAQEWCEWFKTLQALVKIPHPPFTDHD
jgi:hypothetical protein